MTFPYYLLGKFKRSDWSCPWCETNKATYARTGDPVDGVESEDGIICLLCERAFTAGQVKLGSDGNELIAKAKHLGLIK